MTKQPDPIQSAQLDHTPHAIATRSGNRTAATRSPALLIFVAWITGTLVFELAAIDAVRSISVPSGWNDRAQWTKAWPSRRTELERLSATARPDRNT